MGDKMGNEVSAIIYQIIILTLLGATGYIAGKKKVLPADTHKYISALILKITMPFLLFTTMGNYSFTSDTLKNGLLISVFGALFVLISGLIGLVSTKLFGIKDKAKNVYIASSMFGNVIFMAYPLIRAMYGDNGDMGIVYAIFFNIANDAILWTVGVYLFNKHKATSWKENLSHLINPNIIAFLGGFVIIGLKQFFHIDQYPMYSKAWDIVYSAFNGLGHTTIYLSMIFIGLILANIKINGIKYLISRWRFLFFSLSKLLIVPLIALLFFSLFNFDSNVVKIVVVQLGMPAATIVSALALQYDSDYNTATEGVFFSTILSVFSLPLLVYLISL